MTRGLLLTSFGMLSSEPGRTDIEFRPITAATAWQVVTLSQPDGPTSPLIAVDFVASGLRLAVNDDGDLETRPAGTWAWFEQFVGGTLPDGREILLRSVDVGQASAPVFLLAPVAA